MANQRIIIVGGFVAAAIDNTTGGLGFACRSLVASRLSRSVTWLQIENTMRSQPPPGVAIRSWDAAGRVALLARYLATGRVDGFFAFTPYAATSLLEKGTMALMAKAAGKRVVLSLRSEVRPFNHDRWLGGFKRRVFRACDVVLCQGPQAAQALQALFDLPADKIKVVPNWIDIPAFEGVRQRRAMRAASARADAPLTFLYMAWLETFKGFPELLQACGRLADQGRSFRVIVCGGGTLAASAAAECERLGCAAQVDMRGWVFDDDKLDAIAAADVLVLPSHSEGMPNAVLESMAAGLAAVATRVGGIPTLIDDGETGLLIDKQDVAELTAAMARLIDDPALVAQMGAAALDRARRNHDIEALVPRMAEALGVSLSSAPGRHPGEARRC